MDSPVIVLPPASRLGWALSFSLWLALPAAGQSLPAADQVIEAYVEAIGGRDAHLATESLRSTGTIEMPAMGIRGEFEVVQLPPDRIVTRIELPGVGQILSGFDGTVGWSVNPLTGPMIMEGVELAQARERASLLAGLRDPEIVPERETVETAEYDGEACWRVRLRWRSGRETFDCYSEATGLLIASEESQVSPMGEIEVTMR